MYRNTEMKRLAVQKREISVFLYTDIGPSPCIETRKWAVWLDKKGKFPCFYTRLYEHRRISKLGNVRFGWTKKENICVSITDIFPYSCIETQILKNIPVLDMIILQHPCIETRKWSPYGKQVVNDRV